MKRPPECRATDVNPDPQLIQPKTTLKPLVSVY